MKKLQFLVFAVLIMMASCTETDLIVNDQKTVSQSTTTRSYTISPSQAAENLKAFLACNIGGTRNGEGIPEIESMNAIVVDSHSTRAFDPGPIQQMDTIAYFANLTMGEGYAFMTADSRDDDNIIAVVEKGKMSQETVDKALSLLKRTERKIYQDYPIDGAGTIEINGDTIINPNTFSLYSEKSNNDTIVGNYTYEPLANFTGGSSSTALSSSNDQFIQEYVASLCLDYAMYNHDRNKHIDTGTSEFRPDVPGLDEPMLTSETEFTPWQTEDEIQPLFTQFTRWTQESPFNDMIYKNRYAGCFPLAIAKTMTRTKTPNNFEVSGYTIDWSALGTDYLSPEGKKSAAYLIRNIVKLCDCKVFKGGTFTFPYKAVKYLKSHDFNNVKTHNYTYTLCKNELKNGKTLIIYGVPRYWDITRSHCWNIDGFKTKSREKITKYYSNGKLVSTVSEKINSEMVHCDMGWGGKGNGYYASGVFKPYYEDTELDSTQAPGEWYYTNYIHLITY